MTTHITFVTFTAFDQKNLQVAYEDASPVMLYSIKRRIRILCPTSRIARIRHYEAKLLNDEKIKDNNNGDSGQPPVQPLKKQTP